MIVCRARDDLNSDVDVNNSILTKEHVGTIVLIYKLYVEARGQDQVMHIHVDGGVEIPFEQMFQIYVGVKHVHTTYKNVKELNVYLVDSMTVRCFRSLLNLITPTVKIKVHIVKPA
jgi:hypothetical protein